MSTVQAALTLRGDRKTGQDVRLIFKPFFKTI